MKVLILEVDKDELIRGTIREGKKTEMPSMKDNWFFNFNKHIQSNDKTGFVLVKEDTPKVIEGCMIFSLHETFGPYMDYLEIAPHNKGRNGKYKRVAGCLIAYACGLSFSKGINHDRGILTFQAYSEGKDSTKELEKYYRDKYGAIMNPFQHMEIHQDQGRHLIEEYLNDKKD